MTTLYIILVVVLFALAISDLIVGVSNDAVNFLNSAIGSKSAPFWALMIVASIGIVVGATFSSGMMEIARKGIFHPQHFYFSEIMIIFLAVMITDVILLDMFNTFGLPTSTTVSIVFELLGAAVAVSIIKISNDPNALEMSEYINTGKALAIISGILLSVIVAFSVGAIVQYFTRLIFSFNYKKNVKYYGSIWGGIAISAITYFILIKGAKGASFMTDEMKSLISHNTVIILFSSFFIWTILLQLLSWLFNLNVLKTIVLVGTFALAMAFAGNDLVNFIGVPLAGFESFKAWIADSANNPDTFAMSMLTGKIKTPTEYLIIAGLIMVITLWISKKARSVVKTSLDLSRQEAGEERFGSSFFARSVVRGGLNINKYITKIIPVAISRRIDKQFDQSIYILEETKEDKASFDLVRASVNLVVASILISFATSLKLPLSTTYVTFMVAMGTSLADRAWGRESAVYRVTGVLAIIGGWFFTALIAFTVSFIIALLINWGGIFAIFILILLAVFIIYRTHILHSKKSISKEKELEEDSIVLEREKILQKSSANIIKNVSKFSELYNQIIVGLINEDRKQLQNTKNEVNILNANAKKLKDGIFKTLKKFHDDSIESGPFYVQVLDYVREMAHCMTFIANPSFNHIDNNHPKLNQYQIDNLIKVKLSLDDLAKKMLKIIKSEEFSEVDQAIEIQHEILTMLDDFRKEQIRKIKKEDAGTKTSMLYFGLLYETKNLLLFAINLLKAYRDFVLYSKNQQ